MNNLITNQIRFISISFQSAIDIVNKTYTTIKDVAQHPKTIKAIKIAIWTIYVTAVIVYALGQTARIGYEYVVARTEIYIQSVSKKEEQPMAQIESFSEPTIFPPVTFDAEVETLEKLELEELRQLARNAKIKGWNITGKERLIQKLS